jgi:cellulose synthase/poly-beta-1,6-N-acetylglucosamine synthase-like glycosyltransferase
VRGFARQGVILHRRPERIGKSVAQNHAMKVSTGEIIVFSDATTMYERDTVSKIVRSFADSEVGCVAGQLIYVRGEGTAIGQGCRSYWGYEKFLKHCESRIGSLIGVSGCLYAVRRSSYGRIALDMSSDFVIASEMYLQGLRTVYDHEAISVEDTNNRGRDEFRMRVRVIEQTMSAIQRYAEALNPFRHGMYAFQMISHKVLRYAVPFFLLAAFIANLTLLNASPFYRNAFIIQAGLYLTALLGWCSDRVGLKLRLLALPYYFVLANAASLIAFLKYMQGDAHIVWEPLRETGSSEGV